MEELGEAMSEEDLEEYEKMALRYVTLLQTLDDEKAANAPQRKPRQQRVASYNFLCGLDSQLRAMTGFGLQKFALPAFAPTPLRRIPATLTLTLDQSSISWSSTYFLLYAKMLCLIVWNDPYHRMWNDARAAIKECGCWGSIIALLPVLNLAYGPWSGCKWFSEMTDAMLDWARSFSPKDSLWKWICPRLIADRAELSEIGAPDKAADLFEEIKSDEMFRVKGPRVTLCRWWNWFDAAVWLLPRWHLKALVLLYMGIVDGSRLKQMAVDTLKSLTPKLSKTETGDEAVSMHASKEAADRVRDKCKHPCQSDC